MFRRMRINTQERAISGDINRLQSFAAAGFNEAMRHMLLIGTSDDDLNLYADPATVTSPLTAEILRGLCVRPAIGSLNLLVDSGVIFVIDPTNIGADDSICVPIKSDGVTLPGALAMTGNASGSVRIDVIECRLNSVPLTATDNRDIFDPTTGLFTATTVTKEIEQQLEFRVRLGTPGGGYPGAAAGWFPLCVAYVPNGATDNDAITFWDVRSLSEDRVQSPYDVDRVSERVSCDGMFRRVSSTSWIMNGFFRGNYKGRRVGGTMRRGSPGTDADQIEFFDAMNKEGAIVEPPSTSANYYIYLLFPFGLPRWSRYTDASSGNRAPRNPKGIPIFSLVKPTVSGAPSAPISLGAFFAGATTDQGIMVAPVKNAGSVMGSAWFDGKVVRLGNSSTFFESPINGATSGSPRYQFTDDRIPRNAKFVYGYITRSDSLNTGIWIELTNQGVVQWDGADNGFIDMSANVRFASGLASNPTGGTTSRLSYTDSARLPLPQGWPGPGLATQTFHIFLSAGSVVSSSMTIEGWEF